MSMIKKVTKLFYKSKDGSMDTVFLILVLLLLTFGLVMLFSASYANAYYVYDDALHFIKRQFVFAALGVIAMLIISKIDYQILRKFVLPLFILTIILLVVVLFCPPLNGARRWIPIGSQTIQPSEIAKFSIILLFSQLISLNYKKMKTFKYGVLPFMLVLGVISVLMVLEPHLSGTILILSIGLSMMLIGGTNLKWFAVGGIAVAVGIAVIIAIPGLIE